MRTECSKQTGFALFVLTNKFPVMNYAQQHAQKSEITMDYFRARNILGGFAAFADENDMMQAASYLLKEGKTEDLMAPISLLINAGKIDKGGNIL